MSPPDAVMSRAYQNDDIMGSDIDYNYAEENIPESTIM